MLNIEVIEGKLLGNNSDRRNSKGEINLLGISGNIPISKDLLSRHLLLNGNIGTGKTNAMFQIINQLKVIMDEKDVMIIFDTKGDFYREFYRDGIDEVVSNDITTTQIWSLIREALVDGVANADINIREICNMIFEDKIAKSSSPFFPTAAREILIGIIQFVMRAELINDDKKNPDFSNHNIFKFIQNTNIDELINSFDKYSDLAGLNDYLKGGNQSEQAIGIFSELRSVVNEIFIGNFKERGMFSVRQFIRDKGARILLIEYDMAIGKTLTPIYKTLYDLAIKEALSRNSSAGNVYFIIDEFKLLPQLHHVENGINFGRSFGAKFIVAMQNIQQVYESYGESLAKSILSGFSTVISFRVSEASTREFIKSLHGKNRKKIIYKGLKYSEGYKEQIIEGNVIEDWDIGRLGVGEAIVSIEEENPIRFQFKQYKT